MTFFSHMKQSQRSYLDLAAACLAFSSAIFFYSYITADPDLWGHIKFGEDLWHSKTIPPTDPYSFTAFGKTWINHEWLAELIFYLTYRYAGDGGLLLGKLAIGLAVTGIIWNICRLRGRHPLMAGALLALAAAVISPGFMIRPQVFSFLFFSLFVYLFHLFHEKNKDRLFLLPLLMAIWVNLHGGFLIGWVLCAVVTLWDTVDRLVLGGERGISRLWAWFLLTTAAVLANPYGHGLIVFLYNTLRLPRQISEWAPVPLWDLSHPYLKMMALLFLLTLFLKRTRQRGWELVSIAIMLFAAFRHERHAPFFAIMAAPYLVARFSSLLERSQHKPSGPVLSVKMQHMMALLFFIVASYQLYHGGRQYVRAGLRIIVDPQTYPVGALRFIKANQLEGNIIVPFDWGEHAIWKLYPKCRVSIDGRFRTVYPETVIQDHFVAEQDGARWEALIRKYDGDILLARQNTFSQNLINENGTWVYVYSDPLALIFINKNNANPLRRYKEGKLHYPTKPPTIYFPG